MTLSRFTVGKCGCMDEEYQCSRKLRFRHYYLWLFVQVALSHIPPLRMLEVLLKCIRGITIHINESKIHVSYSENHDSIRHLFQPSPIPLLRVHLNGIGNISIHLNVPKNYELHTNVGRLRLFLQNITCTYDLANGIAQNNLNSMHFFVNKQRNWNDSN